MMRVLPSKLPAALLILLALSLASRLITLGAHPDARPEVDGLPDARRPIHVQVVSKTEFAERLANEGGFDVGSSARCTRVGLFDLGLVARVEPSSTSGFPSVVDLVTELPAVPAFYVQGSDTIFTYAKDTPSLGHEYIHALDDQISDRMEVSNGDASLDEKIAVRSVVEGSALAILDSPRLPLRLGPDLDRNIWNLAYSVGPSFVRSRMGNGPANAFALHPSTTYEVLFGEPSGDAVSKVTTPPPPSALCSDRLGVLALLTALHVSNAPQSFAENIVPNWRGDRMDVYLDESGKREVAWTVLLADSTAVKQWTQGPALWLNSHGSRTRVTGHFVGDDLHRP